MHDWPGQIDELAGVIDEACTHAEGFEVTLRDLPKRLIQAADAARFTRKQLEPIELEKVLADVELKLIEGTPARRKGEQKQSSAPVRHDPTETLSLHGAAGIGCRRR